MSRRVIVVRSTRRAARDASESQKLVLAALRSNTEGSGGREGWKDVYLDNARPPGMSVTSFRSQLSALAKRGLYKPIDGWAFGEVKMTGDSAPADAALRPPRFILRLDERAKKYEIYDTEGRASVSVFPYRSNYAWDKQDKSRAYGEARRRLDELNAQHPQKDSRARDWTREQLERKDDSTLRNIAKYAGVSQQLSRLELVEGILRATAAHAMRPYGQRDRAPGQDRHFSRERGYVAKIFVDGAETAKSEPFISERSAQKWASEKIEKLAREGRRAVARYFSVMFDPAVA